MWRSEDEMLEVVRQRAARRRQRRLLGVTATSCVVVALALGVAVLAGGDGKPSEVRVAGSVEGGGASRGGPAPSRSGQEEATTTLAMPPPSTDGDTLTVQPLHPRTEASVPPPTAAPSTVPDTRPTDSGSNSSSSPDTPVSTVAPPTTVPSSGGPTGSTPQRVTVNPNAVELRPRPFDSAAPYGSSSVAVRFWGGLPACEPIGRVDVQETASTVTITLYTGRPPGEPQACIAIAVYQELIVDLSAPVGGRTIVDGAA